jgi:pimeloyl-ACP methyl ester carboxylesterase
MDARPILPLIQAPTLVLHRRDCQFIPIANGRYLVERIPDARLVELAGTEQSLFWETPDLVLDHHRAGPHPDAPRRPANPDAGHGALH